MKEAPVQGTLEMYTNVAACYAKEDFAGAAAFLRTAAIIFHGACERLNSRITNRYVTTGVDGVPLPTIPQAARVAAHEFLDEGNVEIASRALDIAYQFASV